MSEYIDVRGPWPIFFQGFNAYTLEGFSRNVTVEQAKTYLLDIATTDAFYKRLYNGESE